MPKKGEIGRIGQFRYSGIIYEEYLPELLGKKGVEVYKEMSDNDDTIGAILFVIEMLMRQCTFTIESGGDTAKDKEAAEFVKSCMNDMQSSWGDTISEIVSFLTYGWSYHEIVYKRRMGKTKDKRTKTKKSEKKRCKFSKRLFPKVLLSFIINISFLFFVIRPFNYSIMYRQSQVEVPIFHLIFT